MRSEMTHSEIQIITHKNIKEVDAFYCDANCRLNIVDQCEEIALVQTLSFS